MSHQQPNKLQLLIERQQRRLEQQRVVAETRRQEQQSLFEEEENKRVSLENIALEKQAIVRRKHQQAKHLENWNLHFGQPKRSEALSPSTPFATASVQSSPTVSSPTLSSPTPTKTTNIVVRRRGARRNVTSVIPYSATVVHAAKLEVQRQRRTQLEQQQRTESLRAGPVVGSTWTQSIALLQRAAASSGSNCGGIYTSTAVQQRTLGSSTLLSPSVPNTPLRPGEKSLQDRTAFNASMNAALFNASEQQWNDVVVNEGNDRIKAQHVPEDEQSPIWRTDLPLGMKQHQPPPPRTSTTTRIQSKHRTTYIDNSIRNMVYNGFTCRVLLPLEMKRFRLVFTPLQRILVRKYQQLLQLAWSTLWNNVERQRFKMFQLGESRLNHRKARKHHWFVSVGRAFVFWRDNARIQKEIHLRLDLLLSTKRIKLLHLSFSKQWVKYMHVTKKEYTNRASKAYAYWLHASEAKAFRGWKAAVAKGLALRACVKISNKWQKTYRLGTALHDWKIEMHSLKMFTRRCHTQLHTRFNQWLQYVEQKQKERRFLQRAGRRWRMTSKLKYFIRLKTHARIKNRIRQLFRNFIVQQDKMALHWSLLHWQTAIAGMKEQVDPQTTPTPHVHKSGLCDCLKRFETAVKRDGRGTGTGTNDKSQKRRRRRRRVAGPPLRPFRCSMESHLERRLNDAHKMVQKTTEFGQEQEEQMKGKKPAKKKKKNRRQSTFMRRSHWM